MRVRTVLFVLSILTGCGSVPDLRFEGADGGDGDSILDATLPPSSNDATTGSSPDAPAHDSSPPSTGDDAGTSTGEDASTDGAPPIADAQPPQPDANPCPGHDPPGGTCCTSIQCRPNFFQICDCQTCENKCTDGEVCCMNSAAQFQQCAPSIAACPKM